MTGHRAVGRSQHDRGKAIFGHVEGEIDLKPASSLFLHQPGPIDDRQSLSMRTANSRPSLNRTGRGADVPLPLEFGGAPLGRPPGR